MLTFLRSLWRSAVPSTTAELVAVEADIELDDVPESVRWARQFVGQGDYCLGAGNRVVAAPEPWTACAKPSDPAHVKRHRGSAKCCDCSGFLTRAFGVPRHDKATDRWLNTDEMERLARLHPVAWRSARPGDGVCYGAGKAIGHCGLVSEVDASGPTKVIHCSASGKYAVKEEGPGLWLRKGALILRPELAFPT